MAGSVRFQDAAWPVSIPNEDGKGKKLRKIIMEKKISPREVILK